MPIALGWGGTATTHPALGTFTHRSVGEEPSIGSLLLTVVIHLPLFRPLHTKAFLQKLRARRALLRELRGRIRWASPDTISPVPRTRPVHGVTPRSPPRKGEVV